MLIIVEFQGYIWNVDSVANHAGLLHTSGIMIRFQMEEKKYVCGKGVVIVRLRQDVARTNCQWIFFTRNKSFCE